MKKHLSLHKILLSFVGFIFLWTMVTDAWNYSDYFFNFSNGKYIYSYLSRLIWVLPALFLIIRYNNSLHLNRRELFSCPHFDKPMIIVLIVSSAFVVITMLFNHKYFWFNSKVNLLLVIKFVMVGFVEETVFRGWGYNALAKVTSDRKAIIISTAFFIMLHWPAYFIKLYRFGNFDLSVILSQSFSALVWGLICCWLMKKGKTLWNPIIAHAVYDIMFVLLVG